MLYESIALPLSYVGRRGLIISSDQALTLDAGQLLGALRAGGVPLPAVFAEHLAGRGRSHHETAERALGFRPRHRCRAHRFVPPDHHCSPRCKRRTSLLLGPTLRQGGQVYTRTMLREVVETLTCGRAGAQRDEAGGIFSV